MFFSRVSLSRLLLVGGIVLGSLLILQTIGQTTAQHTAPPSGPPPWGSKMWPWNVGSGYQGYTPPTAPHGPSPSRPEPIRQSATPRQYTLQVTVLPVKNPEQTTALLVAHVPDDAEIWFGDSPTTQKGSIRQFVYKSLTPGQKFTSTVRVAWMECNDTEECTKVSQTYALKMQGGEIQCLDLVKSESPAVDAKVKANLAKLDPEDLKLAEAQGFCAVQEGIRLGAMGVPVKVMVKDKPVFLCCEGCVDKAKAKPGETLAKAEELKAKNKGEHHHH